MARIDRFIAVFCLFLSTNLSGCWAIKCWVCAPMPDIDVNCNAPEYGALDNCGQTTDTCHVLFIQDKGKAEITRSCGPSIYKTGPNQCTDHQLAYGRTVKVCNCQKDGCNTYSVDPRELEHGAQKAAATTSAPSTKSSTGSITAKPGGDPNKLPVINAGSLDGVTPKSSSRAANLFRSSSSLTFFVVIGCIRQRLFM